MEKVVGPLLALVVGFALSDLVLVVREGQVDASGVDIQLPSEYRAKTKQKQNKKELESQWQGRTDGRALKCTVQPRLTARLRLGIHHCELVSLQIATFSEDFEPRAFYSCPSWLTLTVLSP